jgi:hypothetical protein
MRKYFYFFLFLTIVSCGSLSKLYQKNEYSPINVQDSNFRILMTKNKEIDFICYYPGGYVHPKNKRELNKMWDEINYKGDRSLVDPIVFAFKVDVYNKYVPDQDFYIRINPKKEILIDTLHYNSKIFRKDGYLVQLILNKGIRHADVELIEKNIYVNYSRPDVNVDFFQNFL